MKGVDAITINLLVELCGMVMTARVTQVILQDRPKTPGDPALLWGDNVAAVSWINRCGWVGWKSRADGVTTQRKSQECRM